MSTASGLRPVHHPGPWLVAGAAALSLAFIFAPSLGRKAQKDTWLPSPRKAQLPSLSADATAALPYTPDVLPGGRDVETPYGSIKVFEWGPETGERVLIMHGISTPCLALGDLAENLVRNGYRVMLFDFFGRGYSDAPVDIPYDIRLYTTQILLVLASSSVPWTGDNGFHLMGYSLGGGIAASFTRYFPHMVRSLTLIAGGGLIRSHHVSWKSRILYSTGIFPERLLKWLVRSRLTPKETVTEQKMIEEATQTEPIRRDASGGTSFDHAVLSKRRPQATVSAIMSWQLRHHHGFVSAFMSSIRHAPIYDRFDDWGHLASLLSERRAKGDQPPGLIRGQVLLVLGSSDPVVLKDEVIPDTERVLGNEAVEIAILECGHEIAIVKGDEVAEAAMKFWRASTM